MKSSFQQEEGGLVISKLAHLYRHGIFDMQGRFQTH